jgi:hypothetical protein
MDLDFRVDSETGNIHVDGTAPCGAKFNDVAVVIDPKSPNPGLILEKPLGFRAVQSIIDHVDEEREGRCQQLN